MGVQGIALWLILFYSQGVREPVYLVKERLSSKITYVSVLRIVSDVTGELHESMQNRLEECELGPTPVAKIEKGVYYLERGSFN